MSEVSREHQAAAPSALKCAVITVSDTRTPKTDSGGAEVVARLEAAGHFIVLRKIVPDERSLMRPLLDRLAATGEVDAVLLTGGTGISSRDRTCETVSEMLTKELPGYGELFRMLSYADIGPAAMLSRAVGGLSGKVVVLTMPGSPAGVRLAMEKIIVPQLPHLVREARR